MHGIDQNGPASGAGISAAGIGHVDDSSRTTGAAARAGDADRERAAAILSDAAAAGYLGLDELEDRLTTVFGARTRGELDAATADLPRDWLRDRSRAEAVARARRLAHVALRAHVTSYVLGMTIMIGIWLAVGVATDSWYPWPVWPALGWGIGVLSHWRGTTACGGPRHG